MAAQRVTKREIATEDVAPESTHSASPQETIDALRKVATDFAREATEMDDAPPSSSTDKTEASSRDRAAVRILEARLFATDKPLSAAQLAESLPEDTDVQAILADLKTEYEDRGVNLIRVGGKWMFRTAEDLAYLLERHAVDERRLSRAALETLAIIAYHQPVTRAEIEEVRGVSTSKGTLDMLMEVGWVRPRGRRRAPGKPVTYGTSEEFLVHFGLDGVGDLPGLAEMKGAGLLDAVLPPDFRVPQPRELAALLPDELPLEEEDDDETEQSEMHLPEPLAPTGDVSDADESEK